ncbi:MAG: ATP-binding cassette domain-containing protein [Deltaproteobacteria bacterium]|nr:ATP-binding cassette domain-containing protein [Deltaproteobacteria bacterium]
MNHSQNKVRGIIVEPLYFCNQQVLRDAHYGEWNRIKSSFLTKIQSGRFQSAQAHSFRCFWKFTTLFWHTFFVSKFGFLFVVMTAALAEVAPQASPISHSSPAELDLQVENLTKSFGADEKVLNGISFEIERGQSVALIGSNSSGKSTLLRCCVRLIEPDSGCVRLFGHDTSKFSATQLKRTQAKVGLLSPRTELNPKYNVLRAVVEGAIARKNRALLWLQSSLLKSEREQALHCLESVGAAHLTEKMCRDLSPVDARRVAIAKILMQKPQLIIADELVADLDVRSAETTMDLFVGLVRSAGLSLLFSSHHLVDALSYADRALALHEGKLELDAPVGAEDARVLRAMYD